VLLLDTCALLWAWNGERLTQAATEAIGAAARAGELYASPISAWEIGVLARRGRLQFRLPTEASVREIFSAPGIQTAPLTPEIAVSASYLAGDLHSDPADRILIATAAEMGLRFVTRDRRILDYGRNGPVSVLAC